MSYCKWYKLNITLSSFRALFRVSGCQGTLFDRSSQWRSSLRSWECWLPFSSQSTDWQRVEDWNYRWNVNSGVESYILCSGSSVSGTCNPRGYDFNQFWSISENESWLFTVREAGHSQFFSAPFLVQTALDLVCTKGRSTNKVRPSCRHGNRCLSRKSSIWLTLVC